MGTLRFLPLLFIFQCANCKEQFDTYTFTVNVDDIQQIAETKRIEIERAASADFQLKEDRDLRIVGFVGHKNSGKTWIINSMFGKKLRTGTLREKDEHGLNMLFIPDGSWLIVDMLGSLRKKIVKKDSEKQCMYTFGGNCSDDQIRDDTQQGIVDQHSVETLRYMMMIYLCHAIIFVVDYPKEYSISWRGHVDYANWPLGDPFARLSSMLTQASDFSDEDAPLMMVAHNFRSLGNIDELKKNFSLARSDFERNVHLGSQHAGTSKDLSSNDMLFQAFFRTKGGEMAVANFGFAQDGSDAGHQINHQSAEDMLVVLRNVLPSPKRINMASVLEQSAQSSLHHFLDGKKGAGDKLASFTSSDITSTIEEASGHLSIKGLAHLECKKDVVEAFSLRVPSLLIHDVKYLPNYDFEILNETIIEDKANGQRIKTLHLRMPGISANDTELIEKNGNIYMIANVRSRRPHGRVVRPARLESGEEFTATFRSGRTQMRLPFHGWSFNVLDPRARQLRNGICTLTATQEL